MGCRTTQGLETVMYDSVTGWAFGPVFSSPDAVEDFINWLTDRYQAFDEYEYEGMTFKYVPDPRTMSEGQLMTVYSIWEDQYGVSD